MSLALDERALQHAKRSPHPGKLSRQQRLVINLMWRKGVSISALAEVYGVARNTIHYSSTSTTSSGAREINEYIERRGADRVWNEEVTPKDVARVNAAVVKVAKQKGMN